MLACRQVSYFFDWLNLLGIFVPPIGAILIVDQMLWRRSSVRVARLWRPSCFVARAIASVGAYAVHVMAPQLSEAVAGIVFGCSKATAIAT